MEELRRVYKALPFDCCALSLSPFKTPVGTKEGHVFDLEAIVSYLKAHDNTHPITGSKLFVKDLVKLHFFMNDAGQYHCPMTFKIFTNNVRLSYVLPTGNVYAYAALEELNIKCKNWIDLMDGKTKFRRSDIITFQDPQESLAIREIEKFHHVQEISKNLGKSDVGSKDPHHRNPNIQRNAATSRILKELEEKQEQVVQKKRKADASSSSIDRRTSTSSNSAKEAKVR